MGVMVLAGAAMAQPVNDNFANAIVVSGLTGTTSGNNLNASMQANETGNVLTDDDGLVDVTNSVWFEWTAPQSGQVEFDTIGSVDNTFNPMDTVVATWTGTTLTNLFLLSADDNGGDGLATSSNSFFAVAGQTYYISVNLNADTPGNPGNFVLNWKEQGAPASGTFQFTASNYTFSQNENNGPLDPRGLMEARFARATITRDGGADGAVQIGYQLSETLYTNWIFTNEYVLTISNSLTDTNNNFLGYTNTIYLIDNIKTVYQNYNTAYGGFYTNYFVYANGYVGTNYNGFIPPPHIPVNSDSGLTYVMNVISNFVGPFTNITISIPNPAVTYVTNSGNISTTTISWSATPTSFTNFITSYTGTPVSLPNHDTYLTSGALNIPAGAGLVEFPNFEMNQDIYLSPGITLPNYENNLLYLTITNTALDPVEDPTLVPDPGVGLNGTTAVTFLSGSGADRNVGPYDFGLTNYLYGTQADTNIVVNFERSTLMCDKTVVESGTAYVYLTLNQVPNHAVTVYYRTDYGSASDNLNTFVTQAGSEYARPDNWVNHFAAQSDFTSQAGSVTFPANVSPPQQLIKIPITQDNQVKFDRDLLLQLYKPIGVTPDALFGNISTCDLTIGFTTEPAGAVDTAYNTDNNALTSPPNNANPGANGEVFAVAIDPNSGESYIGGNFNAYNNNSSAAQNFIAKVDINGQLDASFNTGSGFDAAVAALSLDASGNIVAGGQFHSFNGSLYNGIARLLPNGTVDPTFNPGYGANGAVLATAIQPDGKILIGGSFSSYNLTNVSGIARLNVDGSLDTSFNPGSGVAGSVYSIVVGTNGEVYIGGSFTNVAGYSVNNLASLNSNGSFNSGFAVGSGLDAPVSCMAYTNGQIYIGGGFTELGNLAIGPGVARLNANGTVDPSFNVGTGPDNNVLALTLQPDGKILITGIFESYNQTRRCGVARLFPNGWLDTSFMDVTYNQYAGVPNYYYNPTFNEPNPIDAIAVQADGNILIGGSFGSVGGDGGPYKVQNTTFHQIWTRNTMHPRNNFARLIGGITPGPGNIGMSYSS